MAGLARKTTPREMKKSEKRLGKRKKYWIEEVDYVFRQIEDLLLVLC